jgi:type IV pilus assembly protein PilV
MNNPIPPIGSRSTRRRSGGFSLIEVLIAVLILAIGLLGLAGLQTYSLQSNLNAYQRSQANTLIYEIIDAMRTNREIARAGGYNLDFGVVPAGASIADLDRIGWRLRVTTLLPAGDTRIQSLGGDLFTVSIRWDDSKRAGAAAGTTQTFTVTTQL